MAAGPSESARGSSHWVSFNCSSNVSREAWKTNYIFFETSISADCSLTLNSLENDLNSQWVMFYYHH